MEAHSALLVGELFAGRFRIEALLGEGGMGLVYLARHQVLGRRVALKVLGEQGGDQNAEARFRREAQAASQIQHPCVVSIFDFGMAEEGRLYLAMEYLNGPTLAEVIERDGPLPVPRALRILALVADALDAAHAAGVVHRDLKPRNIVLLEGAGERGEDLVKVLDFGLAKFLDASRTALTAAGMVFGTAEYISPERCLDQAGEASTDLYSLGIIAFEVLVGRVPFAGRLVETLRAHLNETPPAPSEAAGREEIPPELDALVLRCLAKRPEQRPENAGALGAELRAIASQLAEAASESTVVDRDRRHPRPSPDASPADTDPLGPLIAEVTGPAPDTDKLGVARGHELAAPLALLELAWSLGRLGLGDPELASDAAAYAGALYTTFEAEAARQAASSGGPQRIHSAGGERRQGVPWSFEESGELLATLEAHETALRGRLERLREQALGAGLAGALTRARL